MLGIGMPVCMCACVCMSLHTNHMWRMRARRPACVCTRITCANIRPCTGPCSRNCFVRNLLAMSRYTRASSCPQSWHQTRGARKHRAASGQCSKRAVSVSVGNATLLSVNSTQTCVPLPMLAPATAPFPSEAPAPLPASGASPALLALTGNDQLTDNALL